MWMLTAPFSVTWTQYSILYFLLCSNNCQLMHSVRQCAALRFEGLRGWGGRTAQKVRLCIFQYYTTILHGIRNKRRCCDSMAECFHISNMVVSSFIMSSVFIVDVSWMIKDLVRCYGISPSWFYNMYSTILYNHFYMESETTGDAVIVLPSAMLREYVIWMCWESTSTFCHHIAGLAFHSAGTWRCFDSTSTDMYCQLCCNACIDDGAVRASMFADWVLR
jgi:hypothetical protein